MQSAVVPCGPEHDEPEMARARAVFIERTRAHGQHLLNQALSSGCFDAVWAVLESPRYRPHREEIIAAGFGAISSPAGGAAVAKLVESLAQMQNDGRLPRQPWPARLNFAIHLRLAQQHDRLPAAATAGGLCQFLANRLKAGGVPREVEFLAVAAGREAALVDVLVDQLYLRVFVAPPSSFRSIF